MTLLFLIRWQLLRHSEYTSALGSLSIQLKQHAKSSKDNYTSCDLFEHLFGPKQFSVTSDWLGAYLNLLSANFKYYLPGAVAKLGSMCVCACQERFYHLILVPLYHFWWLWGKFYSRLGHVFIAALGSGGRNRLWKVSPEVGAGFLPLGQEAMESTFGASAAQRFLFECCVPMTQLLQQ